MRGTYFENERGVESIGQPVSSDELEYEREGGERTEEGNEPE